MIEPQAPRRQVSLEDLLRLKRAEKPGHEFWVDFEESLRAKQLAAIVRQKPWWRTFPAISGWSLPLSAAAALATSLVVINHSHPHSATVREASPAKQVFVIKTDPSLETPAVAASVAVVYADQVATVAAPAITPEFREPKVAVAATTVPTSSQVAEKTITLASVSERIAAVGSSRAPDSSAIGSFASVSQIAPLSLSTIGGAFDKIASRFGEVAHSERPAVVEPLSQLASPRETRRNRLLAFAGTVDTRSPQYADSSNVARSRERISTHLTEEAIYESLHRLGLQGGGVSIHF